MNQETRREIASAIKGIHLSRSRIADLIDEIESESENEEIHDQLMKLKREMDWIEHETHNIDITLPERNDVITEVPGNGNS